METFAKLLEAQPVLALFLVISVGYAIGQINIKSFSLGVGAVLFAGLAVGAISPGSQPPPIVGTLGMVLFLYGIGVQYGKEFFSGLASRTGLRYNLLALITLACITGTAIAVELLWKLPSTHAAGLFSGAVTTAPAMLAAVEAAKNSDPAIGYSVAYPIGLLGTIVGMHLMQVLLKPKIGHFPGARLKTIEAEVGSTDVAGMAIADLNSRLPDDVRILAVRTGEKNQIPRADHVLAPSDVLLLGSENLDALDSACALIGQHALGRITADRAHLDYLRVFASKHGVVGTAISELKLPEGVEANIVQVRRADADLLATPDLVLEFGDRVGIFCERRHFDTLRKFFGDSIRSTTELSYVALGIGMVLGVIVSVIPIPIPGAGIIKPGIAGGVLIAALFLGKLRRTGPLTWTMPFSANIILRNLGVSLFLAQVGMSSGQKFVATIAQTGLSFLMLAALILVPLVVVPFLVGHFLMRIPFDDLMGITSGMAGNAAIISYAAKAVPSERVEICYAMIYPATMILKIIIGQGLIVLGG